MTPRTAGPAVLVAVVWGLCFVLIQASLPAPAPLLLAGLRALIGGAVLAFWVVLTRPGATRPGARSPRPGSWRAGLPPVRVIAILALANAAVAFGAMYLAAGRAEAGVASILAGGQPVVLAAAGWAFFGERASASTLAGLVLAMSGVVLVASRSSGATSADGVALALLATAAPALGTVLMRRLGSGVELLPTTSVQFLVGGAVLVGVSGVLEPWSGLAWPSEALAGLLVLGVLGTGVAYVVWFWLLRHVPLANLGTVLFLVPVVGLSAGILMGERPDSVALAGITAMLAGVGLVSVRRASVPGADGTGPG